MFDRPDPAAVSIPPGEEFVEDTGCLDGVVPVRWAVRGRTGTTGVGR